MYYCLLFQVIGWLCGDGEKMLDSHSTISNNLKGIKSQQKDFDKLYFAAMVSVNNNYIIIIFCASVCQCHKDLKTGAK